MDKPQRLQASLTALDAALAALLDGLEPAAVVDLPLLEARGCVAAENTAIGAHPRHDVAIIDGWALRSRDLVGASAYTPLPLAATPHWVEAGEPLPGGCDCVIDADGVDQSGPVFQILTEVAPGNGVRRRGDDLPSGFAITAGTQLRPVDMSIARTAGVEAIKVRRPRLRLVNVPAANGDTETSRLLQESARSAGADVTFAEAASREASSIAAKLDTSACDLLVTVGGSGVGRTDAAVLAVRQRGNVIAHGLALRPGSTSAVASIDGKPVLALSGLAANAMAAWWTLGLPILDRLSGRQPRDVTTLPLARKLASIVGIAEIALLEKGNACWVPLALGDLPLQAIVKASAWLTVPGNSEGFAADTAVGAYMLE